ncbi:MAG: hypothetical protein K8T90_03650 [Planctomycetes bacterium]|nr:hypothetical protein [Planctomycetota bacterium]
MTERSPWYDVQPASPEARRRGARTAIRRFARGVFITAVGAVVLAVAATWLLSRAPGSFWSAARPWFIPGVLALVVADILGKVLTGRMKAEPPRYGATSEHKLGLGYCVQFGELTTFSGFWTLVIGEQSIDIDPHGDEAPWAPDLRALSIPFGDIVLVRARASWIDLVCEREGRRTTFEVRNVAYADRQRMLWELAVRVPEAVERGIGSATPTATPTATSAQTKTQPTKSSSGDAAPRAAESGPALPGMDAAMTGLGSSLVADATRNPPPPKSSLGCGLFVGPTLDSE